jgi:hypothetical protein
MLKRCMEFNKIPVFYAYIIAFEARAMWGLQDCNMPGQNLCQRGCNFIRENRNHIISRYKHHASGIAQVYGKDKPVVFLMEPDFW